jgi:Large polyvalent protein-associated domain 7
MAATDDSGRFGTSDRRENSVRPAQARRRKAPAPPPAAAPRPATTTSPGTDSVPESVRQRFVHVRNKYYFPDGTRAFTDRGNRLTTPSENTEVIRSLVTIAKAREWNEITVQGTERFRKETWFAARLAGLEVRGYKPSELEQERLARTLGRQNAVDAGETPGASPPRSPWGAEQSQGVRRGEVLSGRLVDHGRARYQHDPKGAMSYFVKLETSRGDRMIWGVDLERALKESLTQPTPGDEVGLRTVRQEPVKVKAPARDAAGEAVGERELDALRNRWIIEKRAFFEARAKAARTVRDASVDAKQAVKNHPELVGTYLQVRAAELAAKRLRDPEDQKRFVDTVRSALADSVARGEPLPAVRLRERAPVRAPRTPERDSPRVRG